MTAGPTPDIPLLRKCVEWAEVEAAKPEEADREWYQAEWVWGAEARSANYGKPCGTAYCIAGYAAHITVGVAKQGWYTTTDGEPVRICAQRALGLTNSEADDLFDGANTTEGVRAIAEGIAARAGEQL